MPRQNTVRKPHPDTAKDPAPEDVGRLFLRVDGISRFIVSSPGDISVKYKLDDAQPATAKSPPKRRR
jgi:hypothetical protein